MQMIAQGKLGGLLSKYEESTIANYGLADYSNTRVISNTEDSAPRDCMDQIAKKLDNPYKDFKHWIKEEIIDFHALIEAISQRDLLEAVKTKTENKKRNSQSTLDKLSSGKKTLKTFFKSSSQKAVDITNLTQTIAQCGVDIENYEKAIILVDKYLGDIALPNFKKKKVQAYYNIMKDLSGSEQSNFTNLLEGWKVVYNAFNQKVNKEQS